MIPDHYDPRKVGELFLEDPARHYGVPLLTNRTYLVSLRRSSRPTSARVSPELSPECPEVFPLGRLREASVDRTSGVDSSVPSRDPFPNLGEKLLDPSVKTRVPESVRVSRCIVIDAFVVARRATGA
jgi:hypothetical protein